MEQQTVKDTITGDGVVDTRWFSMIEHLTFVCPRVHLFQETAGAVRRMAALEHGGSNRHTESGGTSKSLLNWDPVVLDTYSHSTEKIFLSIS